MQRVLRVQSKDGPGRSPAPSQWRKGQGPSERSAAPGDGAPGPVRPAPLWKIADKLAGKADPATSCRSGSSSVRRPSPRRCRRKQPEARGRPRPHLRPRLSATIRLPPAALCRRQCLQRRVKASDTVRDTPRPYNAAPAVDTVTNQVLKIVADKTGYPQDMLDLGVGPGGRPRDRHGQAGRDVRGDPPGIRYPGAAGLEPAGLPDAEVGRRICAQDAAGSAPLRWLIRVAARLPRPYRRGAQVDAPTHASPLSDRGRTYLPRQCRRGHGEGAGDRSSQDWLSAGHAGSRARPRSRPRRRHGQARRKHSHRFARRTTSRLSRALSLRDYPTLKSVVGFVRQDATGPRPAWPASGQPEEALPF